LVQLRSYPRVQRQRIQLRLHVPHREPEFLTIAQRGDFVARSAPDRCLGLREHGIAATIPERDDQIAHRLKRPGRPIDFGREQRERYKRRNVVERCFNKLKQWRGIAMRSDKTARNHHSAICLAATLQWV
jgi:hypothetical protein